MKRALSLVFMFLAFALLMVGCSDSPKTVAKKYVQALYYADVKEADKYSTSRLYDSNRSKTSFAASINYPDGSLRDDISKRLERELQNIDDARVEIDGDVAEIYSDGVLITLKKVDGDWKVD